MLVNQILITAQLGGVIASHGVQIVRCTGFVKCVGSQVHNPEIALIFEYLFLVRLHLEIAVVLLAAHPVALSEEALVHRPEVRQDQHSERCHERSIFQLVGKMQSQDSGPKGDESK